MGGARHDATPESGARETRREICDCRRRRRRHPERFQRIPRSRSRCRHVRHRSNVESVSSKRNQGSLSERIDMPTKLLVLQHVPHEHPGYITDYAREKKILLFLIDLGLSCVLPGFSDQEGFTIMGAPTKHPWVIKHV